MTLLSLLLTLSVVQYERTLYTIVTALAGLQII